jgi:hypothetical protein
MGNELLDQLDTDEALGAAAPKSPRTLTVLIFLASGAVILSYIAIYAVTNALIAANAMPAFPAGADPRPGWMIRLFAGLFTSFGLGAFAFRWASRRKLRGIDAMAEAE